MGPKIAPADWRQWALIGLVYLPEPAGRRQCQLAEICFGISPAYT